MLKCAACFVLSSFFLHFRETQRDSSAAKSPDSHETLLDNPWSQKHNYQILLDKPAIQKLCGPRHGSRCLTQRDAISTKKNWKTDHRTDERNWIDLKLYTPGLWIGFDIYNLANVRSGYKKKNLLRSVRNGSVHMLKIRYCFPCTKTAELECSEYLAWEISHSPILQAI